MVKSVSTTHADERKPWANAPSFSALDQQGHLSFTAPGQTSADRPQWRWSVVIPVRNESKTLPRVLSQLHAVPLDDIFVVVNGSSDTSRQVAEQYDCRILEYQSPLGHDVGRAVGARAARQADAILFLDADIVVMAHELLPFLVSVENGLDVALNDINRLPLLNPKHPVNVAKASLNCSLKRSDLGYSSLTGIPHALSRKALDAVGYESLAVPPLAHAKAILHGLEVGLAGPVDVVGRNRIHGADSPVTSHQLEELILGDHLEAMAYLIHRLGVRGGFTDGKRLRQHITNDSNQPGPVESSTINRTRRPAFPQGTVIKPSKSFGTHPHPK